MSTWCEALDTPKAMQQPLKAKKAVLFPPDFYPKDVQDQMDLLERFTKELAGHWDTPIQTQSIAEAWSASPPVNEEDLHRYLYNVGTSIQTHT